MATIKYRYAPKINNHKYLIHPLKESPNIAEGFLYTEESRNIHNYYFHKAIDYESSYNTPVYATAGGYAVAGYQRNIEINEDGTPKLYKGIPFSTGLGYFVQIYHPFNISKVKGGRITVYGHLSKFASGIYAKTNRALRVDYRKSIKKVNSAKRKNRVSEEGLQSKIRKTKKLMWKYPWIKYLYGHSVYKDMNDKPSFLFVPSELKKLHKQGSRYVKWVNQGDIIGYTGSSGYIYGKLRYKENRKNPSLKNIPPWRSPHLHFEEARRDWENGQIIQHRDPYNIYLSREHYPILSYHTLFVDFEKKISL